MHCSIKVKILSYSKVFQIHTQIRSFLIDSSAGSPRYDNFSSLSIGKKDKLGRDKCWLLHGAQRSEVKLVIKPMGTYLSGILIKFIHFHSRKLHFKMPFRRGVKQLNPLLHTDETYCGCRIARGWGFFAHFPILCSLSMHWISGCRRFHIFPASLRRHLTPGQYCLRQYHSMVNHFDW